MLYGKVWADGALLTSGELTWTYVSRDGTVTVQLSTLLESIETADGSTFCYRVHIPAEAPVTGLAPSDNVLPVTADTTTYDRVPRIDGLAAVISGDQTTDTFSMGERGKVGRVDLAKNGSVIPTYSVSGTLA